MSYSRTHHSVGGFFFPSLRADTNTPFSWLCPSLPPSPPLLQLLRGTRAQSVAGNEAALFFWDAQLKARWISLSRCSLSGTRHRLKAVPALLSPFCLLANSMFLQFWSWLSISLWSSSGGRCITPVPWGMLQTWWQIVYLKKYIDPEYHAELYAVFSRADGAVTR